MSRMNASYSLTWEEFAEQYERDVRRTEILYIVVTVLIAIPLLGYGATLTALLPDEPILSAMFFGAPLLLTIMATVQVKVNGNKARKKALAEKRSQYEHSYAGRQLFSFDQEKWIHENDAGKHEIPWPALKLAFERKSVIGLYGQNLTLIPKRVLDEPTLNTLRNLAFGRGISGTFRINAWDYIAVWNGMLWRKLWYFPASANLAGFGVLAWLGMKLFSGQDRAGVLWGWGLASYAIILVLVAQVWYPALNYFIVPRFFRATQTYEFSDHGVQIARCDSRSFNGWSLFRDFHESRRAFIFYLDDTHFHLVLKRDFPAEHLQKIRTLLRDNKMTSNAAAA